MHYTSLTFVILSFLLLPASAQTLTLCGTNNHPNCTESQVCIKPAPDVRCDPSKLASCPGACHPSCSLKDDTKPCEYGQECVEVLDVNNAKKGVCPDPATCGGPVNIQCTGQDEVCIDDPKDHCHPHKGGRDCIGICHRKKKEKRYCGSLGSPPCLKGETCVHDPNSVCAGAADCPGVCTKTTGRICATLTGFLCQEGEKCVDDTGITDCPAGIAADCPGVCVKV